MLDPRWRKVLRDLWLHRARLLLVVPAIAIGLIGAGSVLDAWALVERATRLGFAASNPASATIFADSVDAELLARIRSLPGIADAEGRRTVRATIRTPTITTAAVLFTADDLAGIRIGRVTSTAGAWPPRDGALVIERSSLDFAGVAVGDRVTVSIDQGEPVALAVSGVARDVGLAPGWMEHVVYAFVSRATMVGLGLPNTLDEIRLTVSDPSLDQAAVRRIAYRVRDVIEATGRTVREVAVPVPGEHIHSAQMNSLLFTQGAFGVLALLLGALMVVNLITAMLVGQVREIGVMKTIGARPAQLAGMYLALALALGVLATAIALPAAAVIGRQYGAFKAELLNFPIDGYAIPGWVVAIQAAVGLLLPVLAAAVPVVRGARLTVAEALRDVGVSAMGSGMRVARSSGRARAVHFAFRNAFRRRQRLALTLITLAMGGAIFLGVRNLQRSIRRGMDRAFAPLRYDLQMRFMAPHAIDSVETALAAVGGVARGEAWIGAAAEVIRDDDTLGNPFQVAGPPVDTRLLEVPILNGRWLTPTDVDALVINDRLAAAEGLAVGDTVELMIRGRPSRWTVVGVAGSGFLSVGVFAPRSALAGAATDGLATSAAVELAVEGEAARLELIQRLRLELGWAGLDVAATSLVSEARAVREDHLLTVAEFLAVMGWVTIAVGGLGLASTMSLAVLERTREIGVLRAIGARHRTILAIVVIEAVAIGGLSWVVALPLAGPMSAALAAVFGRTLFTVPVTWIPEPTALLAWLGLVIVVSIGAAAGPAWRATRVTTAAALSYE